MSKNTEPMKMDKSKDKAMIKKAFKQHDVQEHKGGKGTKLALAKGGNVKTKRFAEGGMTDEEQEAADKAAGLAASNKEPSVGFLERLKAGNIDAKGSDAYNKFGAGRGAADRAARVVVEDAVPVKVNRMPQMGEDERPAATGMSAATKLMPPSAKPKAKAPTPMPAPVSAPVVRPKAPAAMAAASNSKPTAAPDELDEYAASRKSAGAGRGAVGGASAGEAEKYKKDKAEKEMFTPPSKEDIDKGMEAAAMILGPGTSLKALQALAKKLASRGESGASMGKMVSTKLGGKMGSGAPFLKELGTSPTKISSATKQIGMKSGGKVKRNVSSKKAPAVFKRGDGIATKGKTRGKMV
jgi:hypothetical protein